MVLQIFEPVELSPALMMQENHSSSGESLVISYLSGSRALI